MRQAVHSELVQVRVNPALLMTANCALADGRGAEESFS